MKKFGTLDRLKKADPDKLSQVEGIGPKSLPPVSVSTDRS